jgi:hypothetical protein
MCARGHASDPDPALVSAERDAQRAALASERTSRAARDSAAQSSEALNAVRADVLEADRRRAADARRMSAAARDVQKLALAAHDASLERADETAKALRLVGESMQRMRSNTVTREELDAETFRVRRALEAAIRDSGRSVQTYHSRVDEIMRLADEESQRARAEMARSYVSREELKQLSDEVESRLLGRTAEVAAEIAKATEATDGRVDSCLQAASTVTKQLEGCETKLGKSLAFMDQAYLEDLSSLHADMLSRVEALRSALGAQAGATASQQKALDELQAAATGAAVAAKGADEAHAITADNIRRLEQTVIPALATDESVAALESRVTAAETSAKEVSDRADAAIAYCSNAVNECRSVVSDQRDALILPSWSRLTLPNGTLLTDNKNLFLCNASATSVDDPSCSVLAGQSYTPPK